MIGGMPNGAQALAFGRRPDIRHDIAVTVLRLVVRDGDRIA